MNLILLFAAIVTSWRITHLIIDDDIAGTPVRWFYTTITRSNKYVYALLTCYYCLGFWVGLGLYVLYTLFPGVAAHIFYIGAIASAAPIVQSLLPAERKEEKEK